MEEIQGICPWPQSLWGHEKVLHEQRGTGKQFRACWVPSFLFVLFVLFWDFTWKEERFEREFWKVFNSGLPLLPSKYKAKLLLSSVGMLSTFSLLQRAVGFFFFFFCICSLLFETISSVLCLHLSFCLSPQWDLKVMATSLWSGETLVLCKCHAWFLSTEQLKL